MNSGIDLIEKWIELEERGMALYRLRQHLKESVGSRKAGVMVDLINARIHSVREKQKVIITSLFTEHDWSEPE